MYSNGFIIAELAPPITDFTESGRNAFVNKRRKKSCSWLTIHQKPAGEDVDEAALDAPTAPAETATVVTVVVWAATAVDWSWGSALIAGVTVSVVELELEVCVTIHDPELKEYPSFHTTHIVELDQVFQFNTVHVVWETEIVIIWLIKFEDVPICEFTAKL